ncbi:probable ubiquitin carboxyl-terminal hydrolase 16 [Pipra filicauda]|uniref:Probable ubiquitin carboxyl-terminal hydrolase 16 n=1 Tax=Pipra filicauda TaxID=649802 RepID=A0A7R5KAF3_9PASS|nr:probable ubiquitin carboxyl-terminal hydrolase 16 [Pipra filicauda]
MPDIHPAAGQLSALPAAQPGLRQLLTSCFLVIGEHFQLGREEDAHDFLCCTVNAMQRACLSASNDLDISSQSTTIVHQIFGGFLRSRVICFSCKAISDSYEAFLDVPLDIKVRGFAVVLQDMARLFRVNTFVLKA